MENEKVVTVFLDCLLEIAYKKALLKKTLVSFQGTRRVGKK